MAGSVITTKAEDVFRAQEGGVDKHVVVWTSDASGDVSGSTVSVDFGTLLRVTFVPGSGGVQPSDLHDITLLDAYGIDLLLGQGANLSSSAPAAIQPGLIVEPGNLQLVVANAGNAKSGTVTLLIGGPSLASAL